MHLRDNRLAFLWDHVVAGRPILPGAAMLEIASAAARTLALDGAADDFDTAVMEAAIPAPVLLAATDSAMLQCTVAAWSGQLELQASIRTGEAPSTTSLFSSHEQAVLRRRPCCWR